MAWLVPACLLGLWLFLPPFGGTVLGLPVGKAQWVRCVPVILALALDRRLVVGRLRLVDAPIVLYCLCPLLAGLANGLGWGESLVETFKEIVYWFFPYWLGVRYGGTVKARNWLAIVVVAGGILYLPLTWYEILAGPTFTEWVTGEATARQLRGAERGGTYRPSVFLESGFVLTMYYVLATLSATTLALEPGNGRLRLLAAVAAVGCGMTVIASLSLASIIWLVVGLAALAWRTSPVTQVLLAALLLAVPLYIALRVSGWLTAETFQQMGVWVFSDGKLGSLLYRLRAEEEVFQRMAGHWWLGWGDWGRWRQGDSVAALDGFWLFALTRTGMVCVIAWLTMVSLPVGRWLLRMVSTRPEVPGEKEGVGRERRPRSGESRFSLDDGGWMGWTFALFVLLSLLNAAWNYFGEAPVMLLLGVLASRCRFLQNDSDGR